MTDIELLPLHLLEAFSAALKGERGELDAWLEVNNEADVRLHVDAYARACVAHATAAKDAEIEALRAEASTAHAAVHYHIAEHAKTIARAERLAEALRPLANLDLRPDGFDKRPDDQTIYARDRTVITVGDVRRAQAALRDHDPRMTSPRCMPCKASACGS